MNPFLYGYVKWYEWRDRRQAYRLVPAFAPLDVHVRKSVNPYRVPKAYPYGETPLMTLKTIADRCGLKSSDRGIDLGCGRGRSTLFLSEYVGCRMQGIDWSEELLPSATHPRVKFLCGDICTAPLEEATFIYLYGTCLDEKEIAQLTKRLSGSSAKVITISYPLEGLEAVDQFPVSFPWGTTEAYVHL